MIPGLSSDMEARLIAAMDPRVTDTHADSFIDRDFFIYEASDPEAEALGIQCVSETSCTIVVTDPNRKLGHLRIEVGGTDNLVFFDNIAWGGHCFGNLRIRGSHSAIVFSDIGDAYVSIPDLYLRSDAQLLFWGRGASAVGCNAEIEGVGRSLLIGDDGLISSGVWIRNCDMHAIHDLSSGARIGRPAVDTVLERHVWLGQDALLLNCERVGMGSVVGARAFVKGTVPPKVIAVGTPARVIREGVSWGRDLLGMTNAERASIGFPELPVQ